ncbi:MAG: leucine-rich repeat domain-containing protein [Bacteroidales bacterium]|nr:leucine-rich repeat domain-containing protein [Bacteroidales bacterium]
MKKLSILLVMLLCISANIFAHDFSVVNNDGKTIYYNITSSYSPRTVAVTYQGSVYSSYSNEYTGVINIPENVTYNGYTYSVTSIGISAFNDCINLTSVTIPNSVISIGNWTFGGCSGLTSITIPNSVTNIGNSAFEECSSLTSVTIGSSVTSIGNSAFEGCSSLTTLNWNAKNCISVGFPATSSAFYNLTSLTQVNIGDSVEVIPPYFLYGCSGLTSIVIPNRVTSVGDYAFSYCSDLTSLSMGNSVISIGSDAFKYCSGLTSITIPNSVTSIGEYAFYRCSGLTSVTIGNSVTSIGGYAFEDCKNLHYVYLGEGIETIGEYAFSKLSRLDTIRIKAHYPPTIQANTFNGVNVATPLVVPCGRLTYYQNAETWSNFVNIIEDCNMSDGDVSIEEVAEESMLRIYPNPVMDNAVLSIDNLKEDVKVILTDEQGREINFSTMKAGEREINLNTNSLANGIYFLRIVGETIQRTEKIIKK